MMKSFTEKVRQWMKSGGGFILGEHPGEICGGRGMPGKEPRRQGWTGKLDN